MEGLKLSRSDATAPVRAGWSSLMRKFSVMERRWHLQTWLCPWANDSAVSYYIRSSMWRIPVNMGLIQELIRSGNSNGLHSPFLSLTRVKHCLRWCRNLVERLHLWSGLERKHRVFWKVCFVSSSRGSPNKYGSNTDWVQTTPTYSWPCTSAVW